MTYYPQKSLIVIAGPTAVGKTDLAIRLALHLQTEILSADSRQFYREMSIGTAKPSQEELNLVKHHFINSLSISDTYTAGDFELDGLRLLDELFKKKDQVILVGGSGLFIKAITDGFDSLPEVKPGVREELNSVLAESGLGTLQNRLKELDPEYYKEVDLNNPQRVIRALEVCISEGKPFSAFRKDEKKARAFKTVKIGLNQPREVLYERINKRVDNMIREGLLDEVKSLMPFRSSNALNTVGYTELFDFFDNQVTLPEAVEKIKQNTRKFAKRQLTWFRKDPGIEWFEPSQFEQVLAYIDHSDV